MVSTTRSGRNRSSEGYENTKKTGEVKDVYGSKNEASASASGSKGRGGGNKAGDGRSSDSRCSSTINKRRSSRLEKLAPPVSPVEKNVERQKKAIPITFRKSGRIDHSNSNSKGSKDTAKKNKLAKVPEKATPVGKRGNKQSVKHHNLPSNKRKRLDAPTFRASFMPPEKKVKGSDISQRPKKVDDESQVARVNGFNDKNKDGNFIREASSVNSTSSSVNETNRIVEAHATHENERADNDLTGQEVSSCNIMTISMSSSSEGNTEGDSDQEGGAQAKNLGDQRENSPVTNSCDAVVIPVNQAYNGDSNLEQNEGILQECVQNSERKDATEKCLPDSVVFTLNANKEYVADLTSEQDIGALSQGKMSTSRHSSDGMGISLTIREGDISESESEEEEEDHQKKSNIRVNATVADVPLMANCTTVEDSGGSKTGDNVCVEDLEEVGTKIETLRSDVQTKVTCDVQTEVSCDVHKQSRTPICCNDCKISNLPGAWHCTCLGKRFESEASSLSEGIKSISDAQVAEIENCVGGGNKIPVNCTIISSLPVTEVAVSKEQFGRCSNEFKSDLSSSKFLEYWVPVPLSNIQLEQYCSTLISGSAILRMCSRDLIGASGGILNSTRKCCDHPYLVDSSLQGSLTKDVPPAEYLDIGVRASGKLVLLDKILEVMKRQGLRVVILFHQLIGGDVKVTIGDILDDFLLQRFGNDSYERIDSGLQMAKKQNSMQMFNKKELGRFVFLIENRACLPSIKLSSVDAVIIFGSDWNPLGDLKALHKINIDSQSQQLSIFRLYSSHTLEEKILSFAKLDVILESSIGSIRKCHSLLGSGAHQLFDELDTFHKDVNTSGCLKTLHHSSLLDDTVSEILSQLSNSTESNRRNPTIIVKAPQTNAAYSRSFSFFGENDTQKIDGEPPQYFWSQLLDGRHPQWRYITGHSQRQRRKVQQFEEQPQWARDENDDPKRKKRKISLSTMDAVSLPPSTHGKKNEVSTAGIDFSKYCVREGRTDHSSELSEVPKSENKHGKLRTLQKNLHLLLAPEIAKLCDILQLPDDVKNVAEHFLEYIMNSHHVSQKPESLLQALKLSLCWRAASFLQHNIDHKESLEQVKKELGYECSENEAESVYTKLQMLKKKFSLPVNALVKCIQPSNPANASANQLHDTNKKILKQQKEEREISEVHKLPEHLLEQSNQLGQPVNPERFHQDEPMKNSSSLSLHNEKAYSSHVVGIVQKQVVGSYGFVQCQQNQTTSYGNTSSCHNASASSNQHIRHGLPDGDENDGGKLESNLQHEKLSSCPPLNSLESCLPSGEVERSATITDEMRNQQVHLHRTGSVSVLLQSANSEVGTENIVSVVETLEHGQLPSSHMHATPSVEPMDNTSSLGRALPNMETSFQLNDDVPSVVLERFVESDGIDSGQLSCMTQEMETSIAQSTDALVVTQPGRCTLSEHMLVDSQLNVVSANDVLPMIEQMATCVAQSSGATEVTQSERPPISNVLSEHMLQSSQLNVVSATDVSPLIKKSQFVLFDNEKRQEQNSSPSSPIHSLQPDSAADLQALHPPVRMQFLPSYPLVSTEHVQAHTFPNLQSDQACYNETLSTTGAAGILTQNQSGPSPIHSLLDSSPNQPFSQALENQVEEPIDLQPQGDSSGTQILQENVNNCLIHPVINARLSWHELQPDPLQNEMLRIRKEMETVDQEFKIKKLQIKGEYESELDKLTRKYELLFKDVETNYLEKKKMLEMIFGKVSMNWLLANEFRSLFSDKAAAAAATAAKASNLGGQRQGSTLPLQVTTSRPQSSWNAIPDSCMRTQATIPIVASSSLYNPSPALLSGQTQSTISTYLPPASVLPVQVVHSPSELFSSTAGRPHITSVLPPTGQFKAGCGPYRSPAPHLSSFRPLMSTSSHDLRTESCGLTQNRTPSSVNLPTPLQVPVTPQSLPSRDAINRIHRLAGDRIIPTPPASLHIPTVVQHVSSAVDTGYRAIGIPGNHPAPTVSVALQVPTQVQPLPSRECEQHPGNFSVPAIPRFCQASTPQTQPSKDVCVMDNQRTGKSADAAVPLPIEHPAVFVSLPQVDRRRLDSPAGSHPSSTTHSCDVDMPITRHKQNGSDPHSELDETPASRHSDLRAEASSAMGTKAKTVESNVVCVSSDED